MTILGGTIGVEVISGSGDVLLREVTLGRSTTNFSATATDGDLLDVVLTDCRIIDGIPPAITLANPPILTGTSVGIRMHAVEGTGVPVLTGAINGLTVSGDFANLQPSPLLNSFNDMERVPNEPFSRLIKVFAQGGTQQGAGGQITEANVTVNGGVLGGGASATADGWDIGIYSALGIPSQSGAVDYRAGTLVAVTGTSISNFVEAGIYGTSNRDTRGQIELRGQTVVFDTGNLETHTPGDYRHSGVHLYNLEGYMGLSGSGSIVRDNTGHGIVLRSSGTIRVDNDIEMGMPLALRRCQVYRNDGDGIGLESGVGTPNNPTFVQDGVVGGTHTIDTGYTILENGSMSAPIPYGQGVIDSCAISNNGEGGVHALVGDGGSETFVYCRLTNSIIWNNPLGGFVGDFTNPNSPPLVPSAGTILTPLVHCTLAGNGGAAAPYNIEFIYPSPTGIGGSYSWDNGGVVTFETATEIDNSIFDRLAVGPMDFGPNLSTISVDSVNGSFPPPGEVGVGGVRNFQNPFSPPTFPVSTDDSVPFAGPIVPTSIDPTQFLIVGPPSASPNIIDSTPVWINAFSPEVSIDFQAIARPGALTGLNDKGADEL